MNILLKTIEEKLTKSRLTKEHKKILENTKKFSKKYDVKIIDSRVDFLTIKILNLNKNLENIKEFIKRVYGYDTILETKDISQLINTKILFDKFIIINSGFAFGNQKIIYSIYDFEKNKIGQITFRNEENIKQNKNIINSIEFKGLFFKCYYDYLDKFLDYFGINRDFQDILKRLDYCIDIKGLEVFELLEFLKPLHKKTKNVYALTSSDKKILLENNTDIKYGRQETFKNFFSEHNDLKIYDKILDILENYLKRKVDGKNPYQEYIDSDLPIVRIELKKKKFKNLTDNSINWVFQNIEALFFDYLKRYFDIDLSLYLGVDKTLNGKKIFLAKEEKSKKLFHSLNMFLAYGRNLQEMLGENDFYKLLYKNYPKLETLTELQLLDEFETHELLEQIFGEKGQIKT